MLGHDFYHGLIRKYVILFGTLFNDIHVTRQDVEGEGDTQRFKVPVAYGPREKYLARLNEDPELQRNVSMRLPRMAFEIVNYQYNPNRQLGRSKKFQNKILSDDQTIYTSVYTPVPYDFTFQLSIMVKTNEDGTRILEQILPYFVPEFNVTAKLLDEFPDMKMDIPVILNDVTADDTYDSDFLTRRALTYVLSFTLKGYLFGAVTNEKVIKIAMTPIYNPVGNVATANTTTAGTKSLITTQPGLTANGTPTTTLTNSIDPLLIDETSDYDYIVTKEDPTVA
jgi:hypothetical protein